jgi:hypothetical protein
MCEMRLAEEYDAAQERGEVAKNVQPRRSMLEQLPTAADIGLSGAGQAEIFITA